MPFQRRREPYRNSFPPRRYYDDPTLPRQHERRSHEDGHREEHKRHKKHRDHKKDRRETREKSVGAPSPSPPRLQQRNARAVSPSPPHVEERVTGRRKGHQSTEKRTKTDSDLRGAGQSKDSDLLSRLDDVRLDDVRLDDDVPM